MSKKRGRKRNASDGATGRPPVRAALAPEAASRGNPGWWTAALAVVLVVLTLVVFAPVRHSDFIEMDDPSYVFENPPVLAGLTPQSIAWAFTTGHTGFWIPAVWLSYMIDVEVFGHGPHGHHITNVLLHTLASLLLFLWLARLTRSPGRSFVVAALFAVHPLHVESVAWITERKDVLSGVFFMLALWAYAAYAQRPAWWRYALLASMFLLGLLSKPMIMTLPIVLLMVDVWPLARLRPPRTFLSLLWEKLPLAALAAGCGVVTFLTQLQVGAVSNLAKVAPSFRISNAVVSYVEYLKMAVWPAGLSFFYPMPENIPASTVAGAIALLVGVTAAVTVGRRRWPWLLVGWLWYLVTLVPVIGLVQVGVQARADRFMYIPAIGLFVMAAWGIAGAVPQRRWTAGSLTVVAAAAIAAYGAAARAQVSYWQDSISLYTRASMVDLNQDEYSAHMQLGVAFRNKGRLDEAAAHFVRAIALKPEAADPHVELGLTLSTQGKIDPAIAQYVETLRLQPERADAHNNLGALLAQQGKLDDAIRELREAVRLRPNAEAARVNLARALATAGRVAESIEEFRQVLRINPNNEMARRAVGGLTTTEK